MLDYEYIKNHYRLIAVDLSRKKELGINPKVTQEIEFVGQIKNVNGVHIDFYYYYYYYYYYYLHIYTLKTKKYNHQVHKYQCTWDPSKKGLNKEQRMIIYENIC